MISINLMNTILKYILLCAISFYIFVKSINYTNINKYKLIMISFSSMLFGIIYSVLSLYISSLLVMIVLIFLIASSTSFIMKLEFEQSLFTSFISIILSLSLYVVSLLCTSMCVKLRFMNVDNDNPLIIVICSIVELLLVLSFFKIKRFSHGFSFLKNIKNSRNFTSIGFLLSGGLIILYLMLANNTNVSIIQVGIIGFALIIIGTFIWIKRNITLDYQDRMKNRKIENLEKELADKEKINAELTEEIKSLTMINHQYNSRIKATKQEIEKLAFAFKNGTNTEFSTELSEVTKLVNNLSSEYSNKVNSVLKYSKPLPKTNVKGVDSILEHMKLEATKKNIDFDLKVNCSVKHLIEKFISQSELETLISDHVKDAIIAVGYSESTPRSICVIFDIIDNCYRFSVYDSGIDFEIDTLVNLGLDAITTHKDDGGTGLGFLTTFGTLDKCKASLVIDEINFKNSNFSKSVNIIFDGKHEYIVRSSRTEEIKKFDKNSRIILQNKD